MTPARTKDTPPSQPHGFFYRHAFCPAPSETTVTALWLKTRFFVRVIFRRDLQCGSGQLSGSSCQAKPATPTYSIGFYSRDLRIGGHPVVWVCCPLFCSEEREHGAWLAGRPSESNFTRCLGIRT